MGIVHMNNTCEWYQNAKEKSDKEEKWIKEHTVRD